MSYSTKQLSKLAGVSVRTLHYYDEIGLLKPDATRPNGYRDYGDVAVLKLQQILFYRELEISLNDIKAIFSRPDFDAITALEEHRKYLESRERRLERLIQTVDNTILHLKGQKQMSQKQLFEAFSDEEQEKYAREAEQKYDPAIIKESNRKFNLLSAVEKQRIFDEGNQVYADMVAVVDKGAGSPEAQAAVENWRRHIDYFWTPTLEQLVGLTDLYISDSRFKEKFDKVDPRLAQFIRDAVGVYVKRKTK